MSDTAHNSTGHLWTVARRRLAELLIVFVGVYAAFLLNRFDTDRRDGKRRQQILDALEKEISSTVEDYRRELGEGENEISAFDGQLARGEMPQLVIMFNNSSYSSTDDATLLQAGGLELLDLQSLELLRQVNQLQRSLVAALHNQFELSLVELANHGATDFYDLSTHRLKPLYLWYPNALHNILTSGKEILTTEEKLLAHIRAEQHPGGSPATPAPSSAAPTTPPRNPPPSSPGA